MEFKVHCVAPFHHKVSDRILISTKCIHAAYPHLDRVSAIEFTVRDFDDVVKVHVAVVDASRFSSFLAATDDTFLKVSYQIHDKKIGSDGDQSFADVEVEMWDAERLSEVKMAEETYAKSVASITTSEELFRVLPMIVPNHVYLKADEIIRIQREAGVGEGLLNIEHQVRCDLADAMRMVADTMAQNHDKLYGKMMPGLKISELRFEENTTKALSTSTTATCADGHKMYNLPNAEKTSNHTVTPSLTTKKIQDAEPKEKAGLRVVLTNEQRSEIQRVNKKSLRATLKAFRHEFYKRGLFCGKINNAMIAFRRDVIRWVDAVLDELCFTLDDTSETIEKRLDGKAKVLVREMLERGEVAEIYRGELTDILFKIWDDLGKEFADREINKSLFKEFQQK